MVVVVACDGCGGCICGSGCCMWWWQLHVMVVVVVYIYMCQGWGNVVISA